MAEINWNLAQPQDFVGNALQSYSAGQREGSMKRKRNALAMFGTDPEGAVNALRTEDPETAFQLEDRTREAGERATLQAEKDTSRRVFSQAASGDIEGAQKAAGEAGDQELYTAVSKLSADQRAMKAQQTDEVSSVAFALRQSPYEARKAAMQQLAPYLMERGFSQEALASFDPTDANLDAVVAQGATLKEMLANAREDRIAADNSRRMDLTEEYNRGRIDIGKTNAGANVTRANKPPAARGGGSRVTGMSTEELIAAAKAMK